MDDREAAEDAVQESALRAWRKLGNLRPGTSVRPWFFAIVGNQCRTTRRGCWWSVLRSGDVRGSTSGAEEAAVRGADLRRAIRALGYDQREALVLHYCLDLPLEEVAAITRAPLGTVKSRVHRAVARLRPQIEAQEVLT
jgi:RNA polymerase sigma-70 factor (ECF subfamily)